MIDGIDDGATVRITEHGRAACPQVCPPGLDAVECAHFWEEVVPCPCTLCHASVAVTSAVVLDLVGMPVAGRASWVRIQLPHGVLMVPCATVDAIEEERAVAAARAAGEVST